MSVMLLPVSEVAVSHNGCCIWHDAKCKKYMDQDTEFRYSFRAAASGFLYVSVSQNQVALVELLYFIKTPLWCKDK